MNFTKSKTYFFLLFCILLLTAAPSFPQDCRFKVGTNIAGLVDWTTEMPFVDVMRQSRIWLTGNSVWLEGGENPWNTECIDSIPLDENGYPLELPYFVAGQETTQVAFTVWADLSAWPEGTYTLLYDGEGTFDYWGDFQPVSQSPGRIELNFTLPPNSSGFFKLAISSSQLGNHIRNIRLLMPGTESTYSSFPYYQPWYDKLQQFSAIRFMDWGSSNNWGHDNAWECADEDSDTIFTEWNGRASYNYYTWTTNKGVPYEAMIDLCNTMQKDMWICVPYCASDGYIASLAQLLKQNLDPNLKIYVEYSNEIWNWMFGQTHFLNEFGCVRRGISWPEGIVPYIQNCLDIFTNVFSDEPGRIVRVVGVQGAWQDVSNRLVFNMRPGSFDAFSPAGYFGLSEEADAALDSLGAAATAEDIVYWARIGRAQNEVAWLLDQKNSIADSLHIPMLWYEGGQHLTPSPFGEEPTYAQALLDVQRDSAMYNLYTEWFDFLNSLLPESQQGLFMSFSFIASRSARYGSWGILESVTQDTSLIPAPKYRAITDYMNSCFPTAVHENPEGKTSYRLEQNYPNPFNPSTKISFTLPSRAEVSIEIFNSLGERVSIITPGFLSEGSHIVSFNAADYPSGVYFYRLHAGGFFQTKKMLLLK